MIQLLEGYVGTVVGESLSHECFRDTMQVVFAPVGEPPTE